MLRPTAGATTCFHGDKTRWQNEQKKTGAGVLDGDGASRLKTKEEVHPGRLTWNLQIIHLERKMIFHTSMIMFHVNLQGCIPWLHMSVIDSYRVIDVIVKDPW